MSNTIKKYTAKALRNPVGIVTLYGAMMLAPLTGALGTYAYLDDSFNDATTEQSDKAVAAYSERISELGHLKDKISALDDAAENQNSAISVLEIKDKQFELEKQLKVEWKDYAANVLGDNRLTEKGYDQVYNKADNFIWRKNLPELLHDTANNWDECRVDFKNASGQQACMDDRSVSEGAMILITLLGVLGTIGGFIGTVVHGTDGDHLKWARRLEKSIKAKAPKN